MMQMAVAAAVVADADEAAVGLMHCGWGWFCLHAEHRHTQQD
jgi:hypothetical protein